MTDKETNRRSAEEAKDMVAELGAVLESAALQSTVAAQDRMLEMRAELASVRETVRDQLGEELEEAYIRLAGLQAEIADLKVTAETVHNLEMDLAAARTDVKQAQEKAAKAERAVTAMRTSTSWRVTSPLRGLIWLLRGCH